LIVLRKPHDRDAEPLAGAGDHLAVADTMISLPSPFRVPDARAWIAATRTSPTLDGYVIAANPGGAVIGAAELRDIEREHRTAEASFWLTPSVWGRGCASAALNELTRIAFEAHGLNRVYAYHMARNPASGRVMAKCGFQFEGRLRQRVWKSGRTEDAMLWARLAVDPPPAAPS